MSIESELARIGDLLQDIRDTLQQTVNPVINAPTTQAPVTSAPTQAAPPPSLPAQVPMGGPPVGAPPMTGPTMAAPGAAVPTGPSPVAAGVPGQTVPVTSPPVPTQTPQTPVQGVPTLDDIKALANDFHRAHPEKAAEFVQVLATKNVTKLSELPPASYPEVHGILKQMMGG